MFAAAIHMGTVYIHNYVMQHWRVGLGMIGASMRMHLTVCAPVYNNIIETVSSRILIEFREN